MKKYILIIASALFLFSCNDFLDVVPKGSVIPTTVKDYDLLLIGGDTGPNITYNSVPLQFTADDYSMGSRTGLGDINNFLNTNVALYSWSNYRYADPSLPSEVWNTAYLNIYTYNKVISEVDNAQIVLDYTEADKHRIKAQAYYGRAFEYLFLVNTFSKHYNEASAGSDPGVPLVLIADATQTRLSRGTVKEAYNRIIQDLNDAITHLPKKTNIKVLPTVGAGYALLSRTYLYKGDYENARKFAQLALQEKSTLVDYTPNSFTGDTYSKSNEQDYHQHYMFPPYYGILSADVQKLFVNTGTQKDKRLTAAYQYGKNQDNPLESSYSYAIYDPSYYNSSSVSVPEMIVTLAETQARLGNKAEAIAQLNKLRNARIVGNTLLSEGDFVAQNDLIKFCLQERRREILNKQTRLFDLKRENLEPAFAKTTVHVVVGTNITYTAEPNSNKLVLPIPAQILRFNPGMPQN